MKYLVLPTLYLLLISSTSFAAPGDSRFLAFTSQIKNHLEISEFDEFAKKYFTIKSVKVTELEVNQKDLLVSKNIVEKDLKNLDDDWAGGWSDTSGDASGDTTDGTNSSSGHISEIIMMVENLVALGTQVWELIEKGKPVITLNIAKPISVLPKSDNINMAFQEMSGWSAPTVRKYKIEYKNLFGMKVMSFQYTVHFQHSGKYQGKGEHITGLRVFASGIKASWGFEFNAASRLVAISNRGSMQDPLASATLELIYSTSSLLSNISAGETFFVSGDGSFSKF